MSEEYTLSSKRIYSFKIFLVVIIFFVISSRVSAEADTKLRLGDYQINMVTPKGYVLLIEGPLFDALKNAQLAPMEAIAFLIDKEELDLLRNGQKLSLDRYHTLSQHADLKFKIVPRDSFEAIKRRILGDISPKPEDSLSQLNEHFESMDTTDDQEYQESIRASGAYTAPPHVTGRNLIAQTTFIQFKLQSEAGSVASEADIIVASTTAINYIRGKILYVTSAAPKVNSDWTRTESVGLSQAILEANSANSDVDWLATFGN